MISTEFLKPRSKWWSGCESKNQSKRQNIINTVGKQAECCQYSRCFGSKKTEMVLAQMDIENLVNNCRFTEVDGKEGEVNHVKPATSLSETI